MIVRRLPFLIALLAVLAACGGGSSTEAADPGTPAEEGRALVEARGCVSCHGADGEGGIGPGWAGLHGSEVELDDGTTVLADAAYLTRAIAEPDAERRAGYSVAMPVNNLTDDEVASVVAYLQELG